MDIAVYSVFLDKRVSDNQTEHRSIAGHLNGVLRIFLAKQRRTSPKVLCTFSNHETVASRDLNGNALKFYELTENHNRAYGGVMVNCDVPSGANLNEGVVLHRQSSLSSNVWMKVIHSSVNWVPRLPSTIKNEDYTYLHEFGVCLPALHNVQKIDLNHLRDWINVHIKLGVTIFRIYFSEKMSPEMEALFVELRRKVSIETIPMTWPENEEAVRTSSWYYLQTTTVNDCLFRGLYDTKYVFFGDLDEVLVPTSTDIVGWKGIVDRLWNNPLIHGLCFPSSLFVNVKTKRWEGMSNSVHRSIVLDHRRKKCLVHPQAVFEMGIHHISKPFEEESIRIANTKDLHSIALVHHYNALKLTRGMVIEDKSILQYLKQ